MKTLKHFVSQITYWYFLQPLNRIKIRLYYLKPFKKCIHINCDTKKIVNENIDLVVISFNNEKLIEIQVDSLQKYFKDPFYLTIADNSTDKRKAERILNICKQKKVGYIKLPGQYNFLLSLSHGLAINWVYKNFIKKRAPVYFGFLDHDIFPIAPVKIVGNLQSQSFYGLKQYGISGDNKNVWDTNSPQYWYLWAGFCFFKYAAIKQKKIDFTPLTYKEIYLDTGGSNWLSIYSSANFSGLTFPQWERIKIREGEIRQSDYVDFISKEWVHTINGSNWMEVSSKDGIIEKILLDFEYGNKKLSTS